MAQVVCTIDPQAPSCIHDRFGEFWGDDEQNGVVLGLNFSAAEWAEMAEDSLTEWVEMTWGYNERYLRAVDEGEVFTACEQSHRQRVALDLVFLLSILRKRGLVF